MIKKRLCASCVSAVLIASALRPVYAAPTIQTVLPVSLVDNRPFVDVRLDGKGPYSFILDTGSSETTLSAALARSLRLAARRGADGTGAGERTVQLQDVHVATLTVGPLSLGPLDAPAIDTAALSRVIGFAHFDGVLGVEIFRHYVVTIDAAQRKIVLDAPARFQPEAGAVAVPFTLDENGMPVVAASAAGVTGLFQVDTGDRSSLTLFGPFWRAHGLDHALGRTVTAMTGYGIGGPIMGIVGRPTNLVIGGISVPRPLTRLSLQKSGSFTRADRAGSIGMGVLKRFRVSFDYERHTMWLAKGADFPVPDAYDRSGLWLGLASKTALEVIAVTPGSPAADAGLQPGDMMTKLGDLPAGPDTLFDVRNSLQMSGERTLMVSAARNGRPYETRLTTKDQIGPP